MLLKKKGVIENGDNEWHGARNEVRSPMSDAGIIEAHICNRKSQVELENRISRS